MVYFVWHGIKIDAVGGEGWERLMRALEREWLWRGERRAWEEQKRMRERAGVRGDSLRRE